MDKTFDSSTDFKLPNGTTRSPDASWVKQEPWEQLTTQEKSKFAPKGAKCATILHFTRLTDIKTSFKQVLDRIQSFL